MLHQNGSSTSNGHSLPKNCLSRVHVCDEYILHSSINDLQQPIVGVSTALNDILVIEVEGQAKLVSFKGHQDKITDLKFSKQDPNLLFSSSLDGNILLWDLRSGVEPIKAYCDASDGSLKPITCFDSSSDERFICGGTEVIREDSFLVFWDQRMTNPLGGYWDSHFDEITQVQFHRTKDYYLASASVDGLINLFDLTETVEEDALNNTLNIESSVNRFCWGSSNTLSCITSTEEFQYWSVNEVKPSVSMSKAQLSEDFMCGVDYLIDTFEVNDALFLLSGTIEGSTQLYACKGKGLQFVCDMSDGHKDIIRTVSHSKNNTFLITGGEDGILCVWKSPIK